MRVVKPARRPSGIMGIGPVAAIMAVFIWSLMPPPVPRLLRIRTDIGRIGIPIAGIGTITRPLSGKVDTGFPPESGLIFEVERFHNANRYPLRVETL